MKALRHFKNTFYHYYRRDCSKHLDFFYTHAKDVPFANWANFHDYGSKNFKLLVKSHDCDCETCASKAYKMICDSLIGVYGYSKEHVNRINAEAMIMVKEIEYWITGDTFFETEAEVMKAEYSHILNNQKEDGKVWDIIHSLEIALGFALDANKETVTNIYDRWNRLSEETKRRQAEAQARNTKNHNTIQSTY